MAVPATPGQALGPSIHQATFFDKLDLIPGLLSTLTTVLYAAVTAPFRGGSGAYTFNQHVSSAGLRKAVERLNTRQLQYIGEPFGKVYEKYAIANKFQPTFVNLKSGARAFWLGEAKTAKYIVVYFHGGGFSLAGEDTHFKFWRTVQTDLESNNVSVAFLYLEYTLAPHATYPTQLIQAVETVNHVLNDLKRPASDILLGGDSAGGNLALAVLSHISHPAPEVPKLTLPEGQKLKALVLVAPWVSFQSDWPSFESNRYKDLVTVKGANTWSAAYLGGKESSPYAEAFLAPVEWWKDVKVEHLLTVAGGDEVLVDPIEAWFKKYSAANPDTSTLVVSPHEVHIDPIIAIRFGRPETQQGEAIKSWLKARL